MSSAINKFRADPLKNYTDEPNFWTTSAVLFTQTCRAVALAKAEHAEELREKNLNPNFRVTQQPPRKKIRAKIAQSCRQQCKDHEEGKIWKIVRQSILSTLCDLC